MLIRLRGGALAGVTAVLGALVILPTAHAAEEPLVVTATRLEVPESDSPAAITLLQVPKLEERQIDRVADALRDVPGLDVVQTGAPGQLTSVFTRGLNSNDTQVLVDGIPLNQGLAGLYDFANLTTTGLQRIEVQRGPLSTLYGPHALGGVIQIFTKQGSGPVSGAVSFEGGSFDSFRERAGVSGSLGSFDYMAAVSRFDTDNQRPNNQYRATNAAVNLGWSPLPALRIGVLTLLSNNDTGNPGEITNPEAAGQSAHEAVPHRTEHHLRARGLVEAQVGGQLRSGEADQRPERGRIHRSHHGSICAHAGGLPERLGNREVVHAHERDVLREQFSGSVPAAGLLPAEDDR